MKIVFKSSSKLMLFLIAIFILFSIIESWLNMQDIYLIPPLENGIYCLYSLGISVLVFKGFITFIKKSKKEESSINKISRVVTGLFYVYFIIALIGSLYVTIINNPLEKTEEGYYRYYEETNDPNVLKATYAEPYGFIAMKKVDIKTVVHNDTQSKPNSEYTYDAGEIKKQKGFRAIFDEYFAGDKYSFIINYDAKCYSRLLLFEDQNNVELLVYDCDTEEKVSKFIHYTIEKDASGSWSIMEGEYVNTYYYSHEKQEVFLENNG